MSFHLSFASDFLVACHPPQQIFVWVVLFGRINILPFFSILALSPGQILIISFWNPFYPTVHCRGSLMVDQSQALWKNIWFGWNRVNDKKYNLCEALDTSCRHFFVLLSSRVLMRPQFITFHWTIFVVIKSTQLSLIRI